MLCCPVPGRKGMLTRVVVGSVDMVRLELGEIRGLNESFQA